MTCCKRGQRVQRWPAWISSSLRLCSDIREFKWSSGTRIQRKINSRDGEAKAVHRVQMKPIGKRIDQIKHSDYGECGESVEPSPQEIEDALRVTILKAAAFNNTQLSYREQWGSCPRKRERWEAPPSYISSKKHEKRVRLSST